MKRYRLSTKWCIFFNNRCPAVCLYVCNFWLSSQLWLYYLNEFQIRIKKSKDIYHSLYWYVFFWVIWYVCLLDVCPCVCLLEVRMSLVNFREIGPEISVIFHFFLWHHRGYLIRWFLIKGCARVIQPLKVFFDVFRPMYIIIHLYP